MKRILLPIIFLVGFHAINASFTPNNFNNLFCNASDTPSVPLICLPGQKPTFCNNPSNIFMSPLVPNNSNISEVLVSLALCIFYAKNLKSMVNIRGTFDSDRSPLAENIRQETTCEFGCIQKKYANIRFKASMAANAIMWPVALTKISTSLYCNPTISQLDASLLIPSFSTMLLISLCMLARQIAQDRAFDRLESKHQDHQSRLFKENVHQQRQPPRWVQRCLRTTKQWHQNCVRSRTQRLQQPHKGR